MVCFGLFGLDSLGGLHKLAHIWDVSLTLSEMEREKILKINNIEKLGAYVVDCMGIIMICVVFITYLVKAVVSACLPIT